MPRLLGVRAFVKCHDLTSRVGPGGHVGREDNRSRLPSVSVLRAEDAFQAASTHDLIAVKCVRQRAANVCVAEFCIPQTVISLQLWQLLFLGEGWRE